MLLTLLLGMMCLHTWRAARVCVCVCVLMMGGWYWNMAQSCFGRLVWYESDPLPTSSTSHLRSLLCSRAHSESHTHARTHALLLFLPSSRSIFIHCFTYACIHSRKRTCAHWINRVPIIKCPPSPSPALCIGVGVSWLDNANTLFITPCTFLPLYRIA